MAFPELPKGQSSPSRTGTHPQPRTARPGEWARQGGVGASGRGRCAGLTQVGMRELGKRPPCAPDTRWAVRKRHRTGRALRVQLLQQHADQCSACTSPQGRPWCWGAASRAFFPQTSQGRGDGAGERPTSRCRLSRPLGAAALTPAGPLSSPHSSPAAHAKVYRRTRRPLTVGALFRNLPPESSVLSACSPDAPPLQPGLPPFLLQKHTRGPARPPLCPASALPSSCADITASSRRGRPGAWAPVTRRHAPHAQRSLSGRRHVPSSTSCLQWASHWGLDGVRERPRQVEDGGLGPERLCG